MRSYEKHSRNIDIEHYLATFKKKQGALAGSQALADSHYLKGLYRNFFRDEPREFIELLAYCQEQKVSEEKPEESLQRLLGTSPDGVSVEKLRTLVEKIPMVTPIKESADTISMKAKEQLAGITRLMHQTNYNGYRQSTNNNLQ